MAIFPVREITNSGVHTLYQVLIETLINKLFEFLQMTWKIYSPDQPINRTPENVDSFQLLPKISPWIVICNLVLSRSTSTKFVRQSLVDR